jgi:hypothetical protein
MEDMLTFRRTEHKENEENNLACMPEVHSVIWMVDKREDDLPVLC